MSRNPHGLILLGIMGVIPVLLCLSGVGVLLYMATEDSSATPAQGAQRQHHAAQLKEKIEALRRPIAELEKQLQEVDRRLDEAKKAKHLQAQIAKLRQEKDRLQQELEQLRKQREELQKRLSANSEEVAHLEQKVAAAQAKLARLLQQIKEMQPGPGDPPDPEHSLEELQALKQKLTEELEKQNNLNEQKQARRDALAEEVKDPGRTLRVDHVHGSEDWQPPPNALYAECDAKGILLQPENQRLPAKPNASQRKEFLRTVWERKYVLFLIRPDGFESFQAYRKLLEEEGKGIPYGYEPIRQDARVLYPERR